MLEAIIEHHTEKRKLLHERCFAIKQHSRRECQLDTAAMEGFHAKSS
jgi:hypothetical protein